MGATEEPGQSLAKWALTWVTKRTERTRFRTRPWKRRKSRQWKEGQLKTREKEQNIWKAKREGVSRKKGWLATSSDTAERISDCCM